MAFAVIQTGGKQYRVAVGNKLKIEKIESAVDGSVVFDKVLLTVDGESVNFGTPLISGAKVEGKVLQQGRAKKVIVFKYHSKTRRRKKNGHRQPFTEVEIVKIG
ncbi:MAG: 50S ribosomal protein L21 [bacterium]|nr:50S ribosomal protein L21 [bacterium]